MKLRIKGNSVRLRLLRGEVATLIDKGFISEETRFSPDPANSFYYGLIVSDDAPAVEAKFEAGRIMILLPKATADTWAEGDAVSIEASQNGLAILVEKDFVCLERPNDSENVDAYPHPKMNCDES